jgi:hypothetical protein
VIAAAARVRGYRSWATATALSSLAAVSFTVWRVASLRLGLFGTVPPAWRRAALVDLGLCLAGAAVYVAVAVTGLLGLQRSRPWARWLVLVRAFLSGVDVFAAS